MFNPQTNENKPLANEASDLHTLELLAPAGNMTCLHAAVRAGADAVYLGCEDFNARRGADNFTLDNLEEACDYAHLRGVKIYLTLNIAIMPQEAARALELARQAYRCGVDAIIVQDLGLAREIRHTIPDLALHISTQMNTHNLDGVRAAAALGAKRITFARELCLKELTEATALAHELGMQTEAFGHGALCVSYSGQCFMSSLIGGRSANRGMCAQACRLPYTLHNVAIKKPLPAEGEHLLSPKDLCSVDLLDDIRRAQVDSLKIEGRMKSPEYVGTVVSVYRRAIDTGVVTDTERRALSEAFSRGFTTAYLTKDRDNSIMSYGRPNNRGVFAGRVTYAQGKDVKIHSEIELHVGDVLEFWTNKGHFAVPVEDVYKDRQGDVSLTVQRRVNKGDRVFRVRDASLAFVDSDVEPRIEIAGRVYMHIGKPLRMTFATDAGVSVSFEGAVVEAARTKAITKEEIIEHVDRLGNTSFALLALDVDVEDGVGIGFSALHKARTQALKALENEILKDYKVRELARSSKKQHVLGSLHNTGCTVVALATNPACARAARKAGADMVYIPALNYKRGEAVVAGQRTQTAEQAGYPNKCVIDLPVVDKLQFNNEPVFDSWSYVKQGKQVVVENFGQLVRGVEEGFEVEVGSHIPVTNTYTLDMMADLGVSRVWLSPELSLSQIEELGRNSLVPLGLCVAGSQELMTTEHCMLMSQGPCDQKCSDCVRRKSPHYLEDRKNYHFTVVTDACGRSHIYNAVALDALHLVPELIGAGVSSFMVDTTLMNVEETSRIVAPAVRARDIARKSGDKVSKAEGCTTGHLFRGVQ